MLLPADERQLVVELVDRWSLLLLASDVLDDAGQPQVAPEPAAVVTTALPGRPSALQPDPVPRSFTFWRPTWGVNTFPKGEAAVDRVSDQLTAEAATAAGVDPAQLLRHDRTPVITYRRSGWIEPEASLHVGALGGMAAPANRWPEELVTVHRQIQRALAKAGERIGSEHFTSNRYEPRTYALPHAMAWIADGGRVHPWDA